MDPESCLKSKEEQILGFEMLDKPTSFQPDNGMHLRLQSRNLEGLGSSQKLSLSITTDIAESDQKNDEQKFPLDLSVPKQRKKLFIPISTVDKNNNRLTNEKTFLERLQFSNGSFQDFSATFSQAVAKLFDSEFPNGLHPSNCKNYSAFFSAAAAVYPHVLRSWYWHLSSLQHKGTENCLAFENNYILKAMLETFPGNKKDELTYSTIYSQNFNQARSRGKQIPDFHI